MTPFYEWSSTAAKLELLRGGFLQHKRMKKLEYRNIFPDLIFYKKIYKSQYIAMVD